MRDSRRLRSKNTRVRVEPHDIFLAIPYMLFLKARLWFGRAYDLLLNKAIAISRPRQPLTPTPRYQSHHDQGESMTPQQTKTTTNDELNEQELSAKELQAISGGHTPEPKSGGSSYGVTTPGTIGYGAVKK